MKKNIKFITINYKILSFKEKSIKQTPTNLKPLLTIFGISSLTFILGIVVSSSSADEKLQRASKGFAIVSLFIMLVSSALYVCLNDKRDNHE